MCPSRELNPLIREVFRRIREDRTAAYRLAGKWSSADWGPPFPNEVDDLKREVLRPATEPAQIMYFLCGVEAADLSGQIVNARDGAIRVRAGVPVLSDGR